MVRVWVRESVTGRDREGQIEREREKTRENKERKSADKPELGEAFAVAGYLRKTRALGSF